MFRENELLKGKETEPWEMPIFRGREEEKTPVTGTERDEGQEMSGGEEPAPEAEPSSGYQCSRRRHFVSLGPVPLGNCSDNGNCPAG